MSDPKFKDIGSPTTKLIEECSELIKAICKAERFGWLSHHPERPGSTNMDEVTAEMDDVVEAIKLLEVQFKHFKYEYYYKYISDKATP